ncbi:conodipine-P1-like [Saccostrea cucullata]|uniref:conodipine-P1-like n=1 Tax=Saccostrea cuccullata TaxID=36930 RepID=UPI002ED622C6
MDLAPLFLYLWLSSLMLFSSGTDAQLPCTYNVNGCSIPGNLPFFYRSIFRPACTLHDQCYRCGSYPLYLVSRENCDIRFHNNMLGICLGRGSVDMSSCLTFARIYYLAARFGGTSRYRTLPDAHCGLVPHCMI